MGYATINGDMSGGFAPVADVTKTKLFALARWLNKNREVKNAIPESVILKRPGAELAIDPNTGKPLCAEDALMPYEFLDEVIWCIENKKESYNDMLNSKFLYEKNNELSKEQKVQWLDKFYRRMAAAMYKWSIMAPCVYVDKRYIGNCEYRQPITSSRLNYKVLSEDEIAQRLK
jgi:NAD+ synthase (glutamine-hydrolysing)